MNKKVDHAFKKSKTVEVNLLLSWMAISYLYTCMAVNTWQFPHRKKEIDAKWQNGNLRDECWQCHEQNMWGNPRNMGMRKIYILKTLKKELKFLEHIMKKHGL